MAIWDGTRNEVVVRAELTAGRLDQRINCAIHGVQYWQASLEK